MTEYRLGVDVGGTHTDLVLSNADTGEILIEKVPSTPADPAIAVLEGISRLMGRNILPADIGFFSHGTTVTTNTLLPARKSIRSMRTISATRCEVSARRGPCPLRSAIFFPT